jgi:ATP synthase protein I
MVGDTGRLKRVLSADSGATLMVLFSMRKEKLIWMKELAYYSSIGLSLALSIFIGLAIGLYLDRRWGSSPWLTLIFLGLGIAAGYRNIGLAIKKSRKL